MIKLLITLGVQVLIILLVGEAVASEGGGPLAITSTLSTIIVGQRLLGHLWETR
jgi:hypothetical protein